MSVSIERRIFLDFLSRFDSLKNILALMGKYLDSGVRYIWRIFENIFNISYFVIDDSFVEITRKIVLI